MLCQSVTLFHFRPLRRRSQATTQARIRASAIAMLSRSKIILLRRALPGWRAVTAAKKEAKLAVLHMLRGRYVESAFVRWRRRAKQRGLLGSRGPEAVTKRARQSAFKVRMLSGNDKPIAAPHTKPNILSCIKCTCS